MNPKELAQKMGEHIAQRDAQGIPINVADLARMQADFAAAVADTLDAAGLIPEPPADP